MVTPAMGRAPLTAPVNRIIDSSLIDGPGSRMAIFLQGCNLACLYCHNPETQRLCDDCGACVPVCPVGALSLAEGVVSWDATRCAACDACLKACQHRASPKVRRMTVPEVFARIDEARDFLDGITVSGGECTLHGEFLIELFRMLKDRTELSTFVDTNGVIDPTLLARLCDVTDGFMFDLKAIAPDTHRRLTGASNDLILANMRYASARGRLYEVRTVVAAGFTDSEAEIAAIATLIADLNDYTRLKLIPFRPAGVMGEMAQLPAFDQGRLDALHATAAEILGSRAIRGR